MGDPTGMKSPQDIFGAEGEREVRFVFDPRSVFGGHLISQSILRRSALFVLPTFATPALFVFCRACLSSPSPPPTPTRKDVIIHGDDESTQQRRSAVS